MITQLNEYENLLYRIQQNAEQGKVIGDIPENEPIYEIDLNTRTIQAPKFLSVELDHNAETILFKVNRYFENIDLSSLTCVIQFKNADPNNKKNGFLYMPPVLDIETFKDEGKMLIPWSIQGPATSYAGKVQFSIKFYKLRRVEIKDEIGITKQYYEYLYELNTLPSTSEVLHGMNKNLIIKSENYKFLSEEEKIWGVIDEIHELSKSFDVFWTDINDI